MKEEYGLRYAEIFEHYEYMPYGETWIEERDKGARKIGYLFTSKELDEETGLYYFGARYLDPKTSRWMSGDPAMGDYLPIAPVSDKAKKDIELMRIIKYSWLKDESSQDIPSKFAKQLF